MRKHFISALCLVGALLLASCSPRDFLTRRLAADLIDGSNEFKSPQQFWLHTGLVSNKDYLAPESLVLQRRGWISSTRATCSPSLAPPPCWDVLLTPSGVDTFRMIAAPADSEKPSFAIPVARRELVAITGISKHGGSADVEFTWKWIPLNEVGAALYSGDVHYKSIAGFRDYDDGWRIVQSAPRVGQPLDDALKNAESVQ
jgi:hypothetical protein